MELQAHCRKNANKGIYKLIVVKMPREGITSSWRCLCRLIFGFFNALACWFDGAPPPLRTVHVYGGFHVDFSPYFEALHGYLFTFLLM